MTYIYEDDESNSIAQQDNWQHYEACIAAIDKVATINRKDAIDLALKWGLNEYAKELYE